MQEKIVVHETTEAFPLHPLSVMFRSWDEAEDSAAVLSLEELGQLDPIEVFSGQVIDGANRQRVLLSQGMPVRWVDVTAKIESKKISLEDYVMGKNISRRHLTASERAMIAARMLSEKSNISPKPTKGRPKNNSSFLLPEDVVSTAKVGKSDAKAAIKVLQKGKKDLIEKVERGEINVRDAAKSLRPLPTSDETKPEQKSLALLRKAEQCIGVLARTLHDANDGTPLKGYESCRSAMNVVAKHIASWQDTLRSLQETIRSVP